MRTQGIQEWTVPRTGKYRIQVYGAGCESINAGGKGAIIGGDFQLNQGEIIKMLVGQQPDGQIPNGSGVESKGHGGAGGTFVVKQPYTDSGSILVIAGGGGGGYQNANGGTQSANKHGQAGNNGGSATSGGSGGSGGNGGGAGVGMSGAGFNGNGSGRSSGNYISYAQSFLNGGIGGEAKMQGHNKGHGGFGGGGSHGYNHGGGGGGYWLVCKKT